MRRRPVAGDRDFQRFYDRARHPEALHRSYFREEYVGQISFLNRTELLAFGEELGLSDGKLALDLGCGIGGPAMLFAETLHCRLVGLDINRDHILRAEQAARAAGLAEQVRFICIDWREFEADQGHRFDAIVMLDSLVHFENRTELFEGLRRMVGRGGRLGIATELVAEAIDPGNLAWREKSGLVSCVTEAALRADLADTGWTITSIRKLPGRRGDLADFGLRTVAAGAPEDFDHLAAIAHLSRSGEAIEAILCAVAA